MANRAKGWNLKNAYVQKMENKQKKRDRNERIKRYEASKRTEVKAD